MSARILLTPGEPGGIGPDICVQLAQQDWPDALIAVGDPDLLLTRAKQLHLPLQLIEFDAKKKTMPQARGTLQVLPISLKAPVETGILNMANAAYVVQTLESAATLCEQKIADALVTGPVHKAVINQAGIDFSGHTEFFAKLSGVKHTVMLFIADQLKVALVTTHLPLAKVPSAITKERLRLTLSILNVSLKKQFGIASPRILVCGLNPHAGEGGYLGREEIDIITPLLDELRKENFNLIGPLPADTIFTPKQLDQADVVVVMYHDQALPLVKYLGFGNAVNVTLGLPFVRTSVDHGTALDIAGTGKADPGSLVAAIKLAKVMIS